MKLYTLLLGGTIRWNVSPDDPPLFPAIDEIGASLLNPLVQIDQQAVLGVFRLSDGSIHTVTNRIHLVAPADVGDRLTMRVAPWLRALRITSKQASLPTEPYGYSEREIDPKDIKIETPKQFPKVTLFGAFRIYTALSAPAVSQAHELKSETSVPLYEELLLDALLACEEQRSREAILYSAIAIESLAKYELDVAYETALNADRPPDYLNFLNFDLAGGKAARKDPIYALLTDSDNFARLLHEAPLYLLRRSLLRDAPELYRQAKSLYGTRNRLGHGQTVAPTDEHLLPVDSDGAQAAVATAIDVFAWFGKSGYYAPDHQQIET